MIPAPELLSATVREQPYPLLFATVSGAHLYGFPSPDSDVDLRGVHLLPLPELVGLDLGPPTIERSGVREGREIDLVTHEVGKFFRLLLKPNGYVLEQLYSPLIVHTAPEHDELRAIAAGCITRRHAHHYLGFAQTQWRLFTADRRLKPLLYLYRVLLTGIYLLRTGSVEANLVNLLAEFDLPHLPALIERKVQGHEQERLDDADVALHEREYIRLAAELDAVRDASSLPDTPSARGALNDLLIRLRIPGDVCSTEAPS